MHDYAENTANSLRYKEIKISNHCSQNKSPKIMSAKKNNITSVRHILHYKIFNQPCETK
jgi:hypothetical protein